MFDRESVKHNFSKASVHYDEHALLQKYVRRALADLAKNHIPDKARVLDLGCGTGALAREHKEANWRITQLDLSASMCALAANNAPAICADASLLPVADEYFDAVFSSLMLQWAHTPLGVFQEIARIIKPDGYALISTLTAGTLNELQAAFAAIDDKPHASDFLQAASILADAEYAGFCMVTAKQMPIIEYFPDAIAVMRSLQAIGATNKHKNRRKNLMTPAQFANVERAYEKYRQTRGLPVTWNIVYLVIRKS